MMARKNLGYIWLLPLPVTYRSTIEDLRFDSLQRFVPLSQFEDKGYCGL